MKTLWLLSTLNSGKKAMVDGDWTGLLHGVFCIFNTVLIGAKGRT
jgi:hypothetical protein